MTTPTSMMSKGKCKHNGGYTEGYICRMCKKPIYTKKQIKEIEAMRKIPTAKPNRCKNCMVRFNGVIKVKDVGHPHCADCDRCIDGRCYAFPPIPSTPPAKGESWEDQLEELWRKYTNDLSSVGYNNIYSFIQSLRSQAYEEGKREAIEEVKNKMDEVIKKSSYQYKYDKNTWRYCIDLIDIKEAFDALKGKEKV